MQAQSGAHIWRISSSLVLKLSEHLHERQMTHTYRLNEAKMSVKIEKKKKTFDQMLSFVSLFLLVPVSQVMSYASRIAH